jgi:hypothetical protein
LAVLAVWIRFRGKSVLQAQIVLTTGKRFCNPRSIHASNLRFHSGCDHVAAQLPRWNLPYWKQRFKVAPLQLTDPVVPNILQRRRSPNATAVTPSAVARSHTARIRLGLSKTSKCVSGWGLYFRSEFSSDAHCSYDSPCHSVFHIPFSCGA